MEKLIGIILLVFYFGFLIFGIGFIIFKVIKNRFQKKLSIEPYSEPNFPVYEERVSYDYFKGKRYRGSNYHFRRSFKSKRWN